MITQSDRLCAGGVSSDLLIEHVLVRSLNTGGGFIETGRGMTEEQR